MTKLEANYSEDQPAEVPRPHDWQEAFLANREKSLEGQRWYPRAEGAPETSIPRRYRAFEVDEGDFQASISPQKWDCTGNIAIPVNDGLHGNPVEVVPFLPGRSDVHILNTGANSVILSPSLEAALAGRGITLANGSSPFTLSTQAAFYAWAVTGASTIQAWWTAYESPTSHLPPKDKEG